MAKVSQLRSGPWSTSDSQAYSLDHFYVKATNAHDHSNSHRLHLPKELDAMALELVEQVPAYRGVMDLVRDAVYHRVRYLSQDKNMSTPIIERWLDLEAGQAAIERAKTEIEMHRRIVDDTRTTVDALIEAGDRGQLLLLLESLEPTLEAMRDPWHTQLAAIIAAAYKR